jgi:hypothetical protein
MTSNNIAFISDFIDVYTAILQLWHTDMVSSQPSLFLQVVQRTYYDAGKKEWLLRRWRIKNNRREGNEGEQEVDVSWTSWSVAVS